jgi:hypothetical protein
MSRLRDLGHVRERAKVHGIRTQRLVSYWPGVALWPCPDCGDGCALAEWDGFGVILTCKGCGTYTDAAAVLLADPAAPSWHLTRLIPTPEELARWQETVERRLEEPLPIRARAVAQ